MAAPTLMYCIGAPKAGTTWLYRYLAGHPDCHLSPVKEMHYFNSYQERGDVLYIQQLKEQLATLERKQSALPFNKRRKARRRMKLLQQMLDLKPDRNGGHGAYLRYLRQGISREKLIADISPCYVTLDRSHFAEMAALLPDVRFVYLLRDPLDRAWSQARMNARRAEGVDAAEMLRRFLDGGNTRFAMRSDYARTLTELRAAVPDDRIFIGFYETLFSDKTVFQLADFLGIQRISGDYVSVHNGGQPAKMGENLRRRTLEKLCDQYRFCDEFFGDKLPNRWRENMMEIA